ncbi:hypothetical protein PF010_g17911 [Phytophthora fragariae]|uniref:BED-type domain-containing protein n=1 Tax=Phytophthora fragariae TaxID=53985 RepID=A0A6A3EUD0_9STRA|nr:hypothetical protein PF009_g13122 [Phytophthora fragariae]KAE9092149.1 hypothetical protein PF010_g17911 [Phytophthora fragariae]KAE9109341.1 hypothetical protein PF007_g12283 [Phytophthora fragariae]KAE9205058.1 hypothetical protein PF004_g17668 [Phytophthora fragariae]KAE9228531.1 hypothetical protein PF002_g13520 [Phytophthora fragariae]
MSVLAGLLLAATLWLLALSRPRERPALPIWSEFTVVKGGKYKDVTCIHCHTMLRKVQPPPPGGALPNHS